MNIRIACALLLLAPTACKNPQDGDTDTLTEATSSGSLTETTPTTTDDIPTTDTGATTSPPSEASCQDETGTIPDGFAGFDYQWHITFNNSGPTPYTWSVDGLPPGLTLIVDPLDSTRATITGTPTAPGTSNVTVSIINSDGEPATTDCGELVVHDPIHVDHAALFDKFGGCIPLGDPAHDSLSDLLNKNNNSGILTGDDTLEISCAFEPGRGNGSANFDKDDQTPDTMPPGVTLDPTTCTTGGEIDGALAYGVYGFITTFSQSTSASTATAHVPYCAAQTTPKPGTYAISREDDGEPATFLPGVQQLGSGEPVSYGDSTLPDPEVKIDYGMSCDGSCYYAFVFSYNTLSTDASVSANKNAKYPDLGFEGFTHGINVDDANPDLLTRFADRAWIFNATFDYCIAENQTDCGNDLPFDQTTKRAELIRDNGEGSTYYFSLVLLPTQ